MYTKNRALSVFAALDADLQAYEKEPARFGKRTQPEQFRVCGQALKIARWLKESPRLRDNAGARLAFGLAVAENYCKKHGPTNGMRAATIAEARAARAERNVCRGLPTREKLWQDKEVIMEMREKGMTYKQISQFLRHSSKYKRHQAHADTIRKFCKEIEQQENKEKPTR